MNRDIWEENAQIQNVKDISKLFWEQVFKRGLIATAPTVDIMGYITSSLQQIKLSPNTA